MYQFAQLIQFIFQVIYFSLFIRVALSWFPHDRYHPVISFLYSFTDPILDPFKQLMPRGMMIDFSPIIAFFALGIIEKIIYRILF